MIDIRYIYVVLLASIAPRNDFAPNMKPQALNLQVDASPRNARPFFQKLRWWMTASIACISLEHWSHHPIPKKSHWCSNVFGIHTKSCIKTHALLDGWMCMESVCKWHEVNIEKRLRTSMTRAKQLTCCAHDCQCVVSSRSHFKGVVVPPLGCKTSGESHGQTQWRSACLGTWLSVQFYCRH